jgi:hypothetical protein
VVEVELLEHLAHVGAEARDVIPEVGCEVRRVGERLLEVAAGRLVEGEAGDLAELRVRVLQPFSPDLTLPRQHLLLGQREHATRTPQHRERQDDVLVLAALEGVADQVRDSPDEADDLGVIDRRRRLDVA